MLFCYTFIWVISLKIEFKSNNVILNNPHDFNLEQTFMCGQCFRWNKLDDNSFSGIAHGKFLKISAHEKKIIFHDCSPKDYYNIWEKYFDMERDYSAIKKELSSDPVMKKASEQGSGIRILKQDLWETTISFIISASNNIPRIKKIISALCENFGDKIDDGVFSFPTYKQMQGITAEDLVPIRAGFRAKYIVDAVNKANSRDVDFNYLDKLDTDSARSELLKINGIGNKVADCILLFALGRTEVFPVDVWINNTMCKLYPDRCVSLADVRSAGPEIFGKYCGIAQQYLFYYARENGGNI